MASFNRIFIQGRLTWFSVAKHGIVFRLLVSSNLFEHEIDCGGTTYVAGQMTQCAVGQQILVCAEIRTRPLRFVVSAVQITRDVVDNVTAIAESATVGLLVDIPVIGHLRRLASGRTISVKPSKRTIVQKKIA